MSKCEPLLQCLKISTARVVLNTHKMRNQFSKPEKSKRIKEAGGREKLKNKEVKGDHALLEQNADRAESSALRVSPLEY